MGEARGGNAGSVRGRVLVLIEGKFSGSLLAYEAKLELQGRLSRFAARRFDERARLFGAELLERQSREIEALQPNPGLA